VFLHRPVGRKAGREDGDLDRIDQSVIRGPAGSEVWPTEERGIRRMALVKRIRTTTPVRRKSGVEDWSRGIFMHICSCGTDRSIFRGPKSPRR